MTDPLAALVALSRLDGPDHAAIGILRDGGLDVQVVDVVQAKDIVKAPAAVMATGQPEQATLDDVDQADEEPASTVAYVKGLLTDYEQSRPRTMQTSLGPSELGTPCRRQIALKLAGFPGKREGLAWAPLQGVAVHALMEDVLKFDNDGRPGIERPEIPGHDDGIRGPVWIVEGEVIVDDNIRGHSDAFQVVDGVVVDWKHTGVTARRKLAAAKRRGDPPAKQVSQEYRIQGHLYGYAVKRAGREVRWVRVVFLARSHDFDESEEWTERYREDVALWAIDRYYGIVRQVEELDLATNRDAWTLVAAAPSPDACKFCPFKGAPCPGDTATAKTSADRFGAGLI